MKTENVEIRSGPSLHSADHEETAIAHDYDNQNIPGIAWQPYRCITLSGIGCISSRWVGQGRKEDPII